MRAIHRVGAVIALAGSLAGCASAPPGDPDARLPARRIDLGAVGQLASAVAIGKSTRDDVAAALGPAEVIGFDSGYEVWLYRLAGEAGAEFVVLFAPSGLVAKIRLRRAPRIN